MAAAKKSSAPVGRPTEVQYRGETYQFAEWLDDNLAERSGMTNMDIAIELGYENPNIIPMWKKGKSRVPLDRLPTLAKVCKVDVEFLLPMWFEQYIETRNKIAVRVKADPKKGITAQDAERIAKAQERERASRLKAVQGYFNRVVSPDEMKAVKSIRQHSDGKVELSAKQLEAIAMIAASDENAERTVSMLRGK